MIPNAEPTPQYTTPNPMAPVFNYLFQPLAPHELPPSSPVTPEHTIVEKSTPEFMAEDPLSSSSETFLTEKEPNTPKKPPLSFQFTQTLPLPNTENLQSQQTESTPTTKDEVLPTPKSTTQNSETIPTPKATNQNTAIHTQAATKQNTENLPTTPKKTANPLPTPHIVAPPAPPSASPPSPCIPSPPPPLHNFYLLTYSHFDYLYVIRHMQLP